MKIPNYDSISESDSDYKRLLPYMPSCTFRMLMCGASGCGKTKGAFVWEYSGIRMYSGIYSGYSAPVSRIARMESSYSGMRIAPKQTLTCIIPIILIPD